MKIARYFFLPVWVLSATAASAQVEITMPSYGHNALACMSTEAFPVVEAAFEPAEMTALRKAQVYFKASQSHEWYFVDMEPEDASRLRATLPRPLAETNRVEYYLFFLSSTFGTSQSEEYSVHVSETGCGAPLGIATTTPASLTLHATVSTQPPIPPGFGPQGISGFVTVAGETVAVGASAGAGSGGLSGSTVGLVAGGGAAAAAVAVASSSSSDSGADGGLTSPDASQPTETGATLTSSSPTPTPPSPPTSPVPSPAPSIPDVSGMWRLRDRITESCIPSTVGQTSSSTMTIQQNGGSLTVTIADPDFNANLTGTVDTAGKISMMGRFVDDGDSGDIRVDATRTSSSDMNGNYTQFYPEYDCTINGVFTGSRN